MQLVAGKSPAAMRAAVQALRAIRADSSAVPLRVARAAMDALSDAEAVWSPDEREALAEACARSVDDAPRDTQRHDRARTRLSTLATDAGLGVVALARTIGVDHSLVSDWLSGEKRIPDARIAWLERVEEIRRSHGRVMTVLQE
jgi:hypothetical protein